MIDANRFVHVLYSCFELSQYYVRARPTLGFWSQRSNFGGVWGTEVLPAGFRGRAPGGAGANPQKLKKHCKLYTLEKEFYASHLVSKRRGGSITCDGYGGRGAQCYIFSSDLHRSARPASTICAGPMFWNLLPRNLRDSSHTSDIFGRSLKTFLFSEYQCTQCIRGICDDALYKLMFYLLTYLLTYLLMGASNRGQGTDPGHPGQRKGRRRTCEITDRLGQDDACLLRSKPINGSDQVSSGR